MGVKFPFLCGHHKNGLWWFRVNGWGVRWKDIRSHQLLFSERVLGHGLRIGNWHFEWLRPEQKKAVMGGGGEMR